MIKSLLLASIVLSTSVLSSFASAAAGIWQDSDKESGIDIVDQWRVSLRFPGQGWMQEDFDDSSWKEGNGGFGTPDTPNSRVGMPWRSNAIWLRKTFELRSIPEKPALLIHHDEDTKVFINGKQIVDLKGYLTDYKTMPLNQEQAASLRQGSNVMAVVCRQTGGGQFIDVHLVDADNVPKLPQPKRNVKPFESELITQWGSEVTADNAWTEYPRPMLQRENWTNLNGNWDYAITPGKQTEMPQQWNGQILVPFCPESKLSGVQRLIDPSEALWYHRTFEADPSKTTLLNFEAVDYACEVFVNGKSVGKHRGGNTPFTFEISAVVNSGPNQLVVRVRDDQEGYQLRGKQTLNPRGIWYTQVTGIWQTVWLESVDKQHLQEIRTTTDAAAGSIVLEADASTDEDLTLHVEVVDGDQVVASGNSNANEPLTITVPGAKLWSPTSPHLYTLRLQLKDSQGTIVDQAKSYAGIRTVGKVKSDDGHWRMTLNGEPLFHWGPLDQGWWPDGLLTPPSDEAMRFDIEWLKAAGFNMIRKHIKVEPRRYYYHCDRLGMMVWQDHVSGGPFPKWTRLKPDPETHTWPEAEHQQFMQELKWTMDSLYNHPSIVLWVPFNERWGQHQTMEVGKWTAEHDPTRLVNIASGGNFFPVGDIVDAHHYPSAEFPFEDGANGRFDDFVKVMGEFGGHGYPIEDHLWDPDTRNWGYGGLPQSKEEYRQRYLTTLNQLNELRDQGICAGVYTQTTDVEGEINGLMTYDRKVIKIPAEELAELHQRLFEERE